MSRIHQALTRTAPTPKNSSRFNPLHRSNPASSNLLWWLVAALALSLTAVVIWAPWQDGANPTMPAAPISPLVQSAPQRPSSDEPPMLKTPEPLIPVSSAAAVEAAAALPTTPEPAPSDKTDTPAPAATAQPPLTTASAEPTPAPTAPTPANTEAIQPAPAQIEPQPVIADTRIRRDTDHQDQVQRALANGELAEAEMTLRRWIAEQPDAAQPRLWLAKLLLAQDRLDAIGALLDGQSSNEARALLAVWHEKAGRPEQAVVLFEQLARDQPRHSAWQLHWAINAENSGQLALARLLYQTYLDRFAADNPNLTAFADQRIRSLERP